jgi:CD36 family
VYRPTARPTLGACPADRVVRNNSPGDPPDLLRVFMWNITNLAEVRGGGKPVLEELGPYVYRKWRIKEARCRLLLSRT